MSESRPWRIAPGANLAWRGWDGEHVVFHPPSGDTHVLNEFTARVLQLLIERPGTVEELYRRLAKDADLPDPEEARPVIEELLRRFEDCGIVVRGDASL